MKLILIVSECDEECSWTNYYSFEAESKEELEIALFLEAEKLHKEYLDYRLKKDKFDESRPNNHVLCRNSRLTDQWFEKNLEFHRETPFPPDVFIFQNHELNWRDFYYWDNKKKIHVLHPYMDIVTPDEFFERHLAS